MKSFFHVAICLLAIIPCAICIQIIFGCQSTSALNQIIIFGDTLQAHFIYALCCLLLVCMTYSTHRSLAKWAIIISFLCYLGAIILLSSSRSTYLALFIACCFYLSTQHGQKLWTNRLLKALVLITPILILTLYLLRIRSANGRLFIWHICLDMIAEKPWLGHGIRGFEQSYMHYQAAYFAEHPQSQFVQLADNVLYPYNEYIHLLVNYGLVGFITVVTVGFLLYKYSKKTKHNIQVATLLIAYAVFAFFSFPFHGWLLSIIFLVIVANLKLNIFSLYKYRAILPYIFWGVVAISLSRPVYLYYKLRAHKFELFSQDQTKRDQAAELFNTHKAFVLQDAQLADLYAQYYVKYDIPDKLYALKELLTIAPSCELCCDLGDALIEEKSYKEAEKYYILASNMIPGRVTPRYKLYKLYKLTGNEDKLHNIQHAVKKMHVKVVSTKTIRMKAEILRQ